MLWAAAGLALLGRIPELAIAIVVVIVVNAVFATAQEHRADRAAERLQRLLPATGGRGPEPGVPGPADGGGDATVPVGVISAAGGGGMMRNVVHGTFNRTFNRTFLGQLSGDADVLDELNPIVQLSQAMLDGGDGFNYQSTTNYLQYHGRNDCVPEYGRYSAGATGLPVVYWFEPEGTYGDRALEPVRTQLPVQGNVGGKTRVALERPGGHFVGYDQLVANQHFLDDLAAGLVPTIRDEDLVVGPSSTQTCAGDRWDVPPVLFGRGPRSTGG